MTPLPVNLVKSGSGASAAIAFVLAVLAAVAIIAAKSPASNQPR